MSNEEFEILDELYFVTPYQELKSKVDFSKESLKCILVNLFEKGWIRIYQSVDKEIELKHIDVDTNFQSFLFLTSKKGLIKHNS